MKGVISVFLHVVVPVLLTLLAVLVLMYLKVDPSTVSFVGLMFLCGSFILWSYFMFTRYSLIYERVRKWLKGLFIMIVLLSVFSCGERKHVDPVSIQLDTLSYFKFDVVIESIDSAIYVSPESTTESFPIYNDTIVIYIKAKDRFDAERSMLLHFVEWGYDEYNIVQSICSKIDIYE